MKAVPVLVAVVLAGALLTGAVWLAKREQLSAIEAPSPKPARDVDALPLSPTPPWPTAAFSEKEIIFKVMEVGETREHTFTVTNTGDAPLLLKAGKTTCQCTLSSVAEKPIPPGGTGEILLKWKPEMAVELFEKGATIYTNDPKHDSIYLEIRGNVTERLMLSPPELVWEITEISPTAPATFVGRIYSRTINEFKIKNVEPGSPNMKVDIVPLSPDLFSELRAISGYAINITVQPDKSAGSFVYPLTITTDQKERLPNGELGDKDQVIKVTVRGVRRGAVKFIGRGFDETDNSVAIGTFGTADGIVRDYRMIVTRVPEGGVKILSATSDLPNLKVEVLPIGEYKPGKPQNFTLRMTYPPNSPVASREPANAAMITITTNHPDVQEIKLRAFINAY